jgi:hypothetical protein
MASAKAVRNHSKYPEQTEKQRRFQYLCDFRPHLSAFWPALTPSLVEIVWKIYFPVSGVSIALTFLLTDGSLWILENCKTNIIWLRWKHFIVEYRAHQNHFWATNYDSRPTTVWFPTYRKLRFPTSKLWFPTSKLWFQTKKLWYKLRLSRNSPLLEKKVGTKWASTVWNHCTR